MRVRTRITVTCRIESRLILIPFTEIRNYERDLVIGNDKCTAFGRCVGIFGLPSGDVQEAIWSSEVKKAGNWETWGCYRFDCILPKVC